MIDPAQVAVRHVQWVPCYRLIAWQFAAVGIWDRVVNARDFERVLAIESVTNDRIQDELGEIQLIAADERVFGPGATLIMAAFTHRNALGTRFSNGDYGVYYCADSTEGAVAEVSYHRSLFLALTQEPPVDVDLRLVTATLGAHLHDVRGMQSVLPELYDANSYAASQRFGARLREQGSWGLVYDSVRLAGAQCAGLFKPRAMCDATSAGHVAFHWDGQRITHWYEKGTPLSVPS